MASYSEKPRLSPTVATFQHVVVRRHRPLFLACALLFAITSLYTIFAVGFGDSYGTRRMDATDMRPVTVHKGHGRVKSLIPAKIWQIMLPKRGQEDQVYNVDPEQLKDTTSWLAKNIDYQYTLLGPQSADRFVETNFASNTRLLDAYRNLPNMGMKSDLLRYLLLSVEGGVYSDIDTLAIRPIDAWIPRSLRDRIKLVVGIEFDKRDGPNWADIPHDLQFCQWTIGAAAGHPVFTRMVQRILDSLDELVESHGGIPLSDIVPSSFEVMNTTGPAAWTDAVFETLQEIDPSLKETKDLTFMDQIRVYDDILVLTIDGFGMGQQHSGSTNDGTIPPAALIKHEFWGSWREPKPEDSEGNEDEETSAKQPSGESSTPQSEEDEASKQQRLEADRLREEAVRLQEADRLQQEAERLQKGAQALQEEAQRQKQAALKVIAPVLDSSDTNAMPAAKAVLAGTQHEVAEASSAAVPAGEAKEDDKSEVNETHTLDAGSAAEKNAELEVSPATKSEAPAEEDRREDESEEDEVLMLDTGSPAWPSSEWAP